MNHETLTFLNRQVTRERKKKDSHPRTQRLINTNCCQVNIWSLTSLTWMLPTLRPKWINTGSIHRTSAITIGKLFVFPLDSFLSVIVAYQMCVCTADAFLVWAPIGMREREPKYPSVYTTLATARKQKKESRSETWQRFSIPSVKSSNSRVLLYKFGSRTTTIFFSEISKSLNLCSLSDNYISVHYIWKGNLEEHPECCVVVYFTFSCVRSQAIWRGKRTCSRTCRPFKK